MPDDAVIDTNVLVSANGRVEHGIPPSCTLECVQYLRGIQDAGRVHLDSLRLILSEYQSHSSYAGQPGVGNQFFLWLHRNQANRDRVCISTVTPDDERGFLEFPTSASLASFDPADRKFVATALGCPDAPVIVSAADVGWLEHQAGLEAAGVRLRHLCVGTRKPPTNMQ